MRPARADGDPAGGAFRWRHLVVGVPFAVWLVTVTFGALLAAWSVLTPAYQAPDEPNHVDRAIAASHGHVLIAPKTRHTGLGIVRSEQVAGIPTCCPPPRGVSYRLDQAPPHDQRPSIAALGGGAQRPDADWNQLTTHPPLYYLWTGAVAAALPDGWSYDQTLEGLRVASLLLVVPLPLLVYGAARRLAGGPRPVPVAASVLPLAIPMLTHIGASVTNDTLLLLVGGLLTVLTAYVATGDTSRRTALWTGLVLAAALLTKAFGFAGFFAVGAAYAVAWARALRSRRPSETDTGSAARVPSAAAAGKSRSALAGLPGRAVGRAVGRAPFVGLLIAGGVGAVGGGWYWLRNLAVYGAVQPDSGAFVPPPAPATWHPSAAAYFFHGFPKRMMTGFFGNFGWLADPLPGSVVLASVVVLFAGIVLAFRLRPAPVGGRPARGWSWADVVVVVLPAFVLFWAIAWQGWQGWHLRASIGADQGRYLYFGLPGLLVACALGLARLPRPLRRWAPLGALAVAAAYQAYAVRDVLHFFWGPPGADLGYQVHNAVAWSTWTGTQLAALAAIAALVGLAMVAALAGVALRDWRSSTTTPARQRPRSSASTGSPAQEVADPTPRSSPSGDVLASPSGDTDPAPRSSASTGSPAQEVADPTPRSSPSSDVLASSPGDTGPAPRSSPSGDVLASSSGDTDQAPRSRRSGGPLPSQAGDDHGK